MNKYFEPNHNNSDRHTHYADLDQALLQINTSLLRLDYLSAIQLAQGGDLPSAESILRKLVQSDPSEENFDLLARVLAQQGRLEEAKEIWERILAENPNHQNARAALNVIESRKRKKGNKPKLIPILLGSLLITILVFLTGISLELRRATRSISRVDSLLIQQARPLIIHEYSSTSPESIEQITSQIKKDIDKGSITLLNEIASVKSSLQELSTQANLLEESFIHTTTPTPQPTFPEISIDLPGIRKVALDGSLKLIFENGLFKYDQVLSAEGKQTLSDLAYQLEPFVGQIEIAVYGFTDDIEQTATLLDIQRALAVVKHITSTSQIPASTFVIRDAGDLPAPYPNNSPSNRMRNRTVILIITRGTASEE